MFYCYLNASSETDVATSEIFLIRRFDYNCLLYRFLNRNPHFSPQEAIIYYTNQTEDFSNRLSQPVNANLKSHRSKR